MAGETKKRSTKNKNKMHVYEQEFTVCAHGIYTKHIAFNEFIGAITIKSSGLLSVYRFMTRVFSLSCGSSIIICSAIIQTTVARVPDYPSQQ